MSIFNGNISLKRLLIQGSCPSASNSKWLDGFNTSVFVEKRLGDDDENIGFVPMGMEMLPTLTKDNITYGQFIVVSIRIDKLKLSSSRLKLVLNSRIEMRCNEEQRDFLSKAEIKEMKEEIEQELAQQSSPETKIIELAIDTRNSQILTTAGSDKDIDMLQNLLKNSLNLDTVLLDPFTLAVKIDADKEDQILSASPVSLSGFESDSENESPESSASKEGSSFLTWLLHMVYHRQENATLDKGVSIMLDEEIVLEGDQATAKEISLKKGNLPSSSELKSAFNAGKLVSKIKLLVAIDESQWSLSIDKHKFSLAGLKLPVGIKEVPGRKNQREARMASMVEVFEIIDNLFQKYLVERYDESQQWQDLLIEMSHDLTGKQGLKASA